LGCFFNSELEVFAGWVIIRHYPTFFDIIGHYWS